MIDTCSVIGKDPKKSIFHSGQTIIADGFFGPGPDTCGTSGQGTQVTGHQTKTSFFPWNDGRTGRFDSRPWLTGTILKCF